ncbi:MAG: SDR family oxidoreductase [Chloroflexi bacterium]|nr:SDR family oxidoreductase [Chloroflexota bacterium]
MWLSQTLEFHHPAYVGDTLHIKAQIKQKSLATRTIILNTTVVNQDDQFIITGESKVKLLAVAEKGVLALETQKRTILVTGASRGIGAAVSQALAREGHQVIVNYTKASDKAEMVVQKIHQDGGQAICIAADVADLNAVQMMIAQAEDVFGPISGLVHCAAPNSALKPFGELVWQDVGSQINVQVQGAFQCVQTILPLTVNVVSPGMTQTERIAEMPEKARMLARMQAPLRQLGQPEDVANVVTFLFSPAARHITGETIRVSGGAGMV